MAGFSSFRKGCRKPLLRQPCAATPVEFLALLAVTLSVGLTVNYRIQENSVMSKGFTKVADSGEHMRKHNAFCCGKHCGKRKLAVLIMANGTQILKTGIIVLVQRFVFRNEVH